MPQTTRVAKPRVVRRRGRGEFYGGIRAEEIQNVRRGNVVGDQGLIGFVSKGGKQRSVALPPQAQKIISEYATSNVLRARCEVSGGCSSEPPVGSLWLATQAHPARGGSDERPQECPDHAPESSRDCSPHRRRAPVHRTGRRGLRDQCADGPQVGRAGRVDRKSTR